MIMYISMLHKRIKSNNTQNVKLLDNMHEGLLILSKTDKTTMFCNKSAQKFLTRSINTKNTTLLPTNVQNPRQEETASKHNEE